MPINHWPSADRPREKLLNQSAKTLTDAELLAIIIKTGVKGCSALDIAKRLLNRYGSLTKLLSATPSCLIKETGIGPAKYAALKAALELGKRATNTPLPARITLNTSRETQAFVAFHLRDYTHEVFGCLFLDQHYRLLAFEELFHGTLNEAAVYPREIARRSLEHHAAYLILTHNHPSGLPQPSQADKLLTAHICKALALIDIQVIDHIIVGKPDCYSFAADGLL